MKGNGEVEIIDFLGYRVIPVSRRKKNDILEFLGIKDYQFKKETDCLILKCPS
jgi:hypothetical protein